MDHLSTKEFGKSPESGGERVLLNEEDIAVFYKDNQTTVDDNFHSLGQSTSKFAASEAKYDSISPNCLKYSNQNIKDQKLGQQSPNKD